MKAAQAGSIRSAPRAEMLAMADVCDRVAAQPTHGADVSDAGAVVRLMTRSTVVG